MHNQASSATLLLLMACAFVATGGSAHAQDLDATPVSEGTAQAAYEVFAKNCSPCHDERLRRPKGSFEFVMDLRRLSRSGEYVVRGQPEASPLWRVIEDGSMPPPRSRVAAMVDRERAAVRAWIADDAPPGPIDPALLPALPEVEESGVVVHQTGALHPLLVHFPIGLLLAAALAEIAFVRSKKERFRFAAEYCLLIGTIGSCAATISGWCFAADLDYALTVHRWLGVATTLFALAACRLATEVRRSAPGDAPVRAYRLALALTIALLFVTSHLGGTATWGRLAFLSGPA